MTKRQLYFLLTLLVPSVKADIVLPSFGNLTYVSIGSEIRLPWTFTLDIAKLNARTWKFSKTGESSDFATLALIVQNGAPSIFTNTFTGISVTKPATFVLKNASLQHNGTYRFEIDVRGLLNPSPSDILVVIQEASKAHISCTGNGDSFSCFCKGIGGTPPPWISWFKNGVKIKGPGYLETKLDKDDFLKGRVGVYYCNSTSGELNNVKEITLSKVLVENVSIKIEPLNPVNGDTVTITCSSTVYPPPDYILYRNGSTIPNNGGVGKESVKEKGAIKYTCEATNIFATVNKSKVVEVEEKPTAQSTSKPTTNNSPKSSATTNTTGAGSSLAAGSITIEWYMFFITLICGICFGMILLYAMQRLCHRVRETTKDHSKTSETNTIPATHQEGTENISVYQELNLEAMNAEDNYQSLRKSARQPRHTEAKTEDESNYQELNKDRVYDDSNYQSLKKV